MTPIVRKRLLRLAMQCPRYSGVKARSDAPDELVAFVEAYAVERSPWRRFVAWLDKAVSGDNAGKGGPA